MEALHAIRTSDWWRLAQQVPDRHYDISKKVFLADHLERVRANLCFLDPAADGGSYPAQFRAAMVSAGMDPADARRLLEPVALLHDLGKVREDKEAEGAHPLTGKKVRMRHPVVGVIAALEILPSSLKGRERVLALVEEHDTPYSWYKQFERSGQVPKEKSWARLDRAIADREDGTGIILLCAFKLADIDGHAEVDDVIWFIDQANQCYLRQKGKWLPIPETQDVRGIEAASQ